MSLPLLILGGPTASGKSALAVDIAERYGGLVVSADAMTVYRGLSVGTAKPSAAELARAPHRGVDVRALHEAFTVADFLAEVEAAVATGQPVLVAGGTPFYLAALVRPLARMPEADPALRAELEALPDPHARLQALDPATAARLHPNDHVRIIRAIEVCVLSGEPMSALHAREAGRPARPHGLCWLDRSDLPERISARLQQMIAGDYLGELQRALAAGADPACKPLRSFAYVHLVAHLQGEIDRDEALRRTERDTWRLARKQRTWARSMGWTPTGPEAAWALAAGLWGAPP